MAARYGNDGASADVAIDLAVMLNFDCVGDMGTLTGDGKSTTVVGAFV